MRKIFILSSTVAFSLVSLLVLMFGLSKSLHIYDSEAATTIDSSIYVSDLNVVPGDRFVILSWSNIYSKNATDYRIQYKNSASSTWNSYSDGVSIATTTEVKNLVNDRQYDFRVFPIVSAVKGAPTTANKISPKFEGYDIFLIAGQSNTLWAIGLNSTIDVGGPRIYQLGRYGTSKNKVIAAKEPLQHWQYPVVKDRIGFGVSFAKQWRDSGQLAPTRRVLLVHGGRGGSSFYRTDVSNETWMPGGGLSDDLVKKANIAMATNPNNKVVALLWHQGESDPNDQALYETNWLNMVHYYETSIEGFDSTTAVLIGQMVPSYTRSGGNTNVDLAHKNLPNLRASTGFVSAELPYELGRNDEASIKQTNDPIHYSAPSQRELGKRYFNELVKLLAIE